MTDNEKIEKEKKTPEEEKKIWITTSMEKNRGGGGVYQRKKKENLHSKRGMALGDLVCAKRPGRRVAQRGKLNS